MTDLERFKNWLQEFVYPADLAEEFRNVSENYEPICEPTKKDWQKLFEYYTDEGLYDPYDVENDERDFILMPQNFSLSGLHCLDIESGELDGGAILHDLFLGEGVTNMSDTEAVGFIAGIATRAYIDQTDLYVISAKRDDYDWTESVVQNITSSEITYEEDELIVKDVKEEMFIRFRIHQSGSIEVEWFE